MSEISKTDVRLVISTQNDPWRGVWAKFSSTSPRSTSRVEKVQQLHLQYCKKKSERLLAVVSTCAATQRSITVAIDIKFSRSPFDIYSDHGAAPRHGASIN